MVLYSDILSASKWSWGVKCVFITQMLTP